MIERIDYGPYHRDDNVSIIIAGIETELSGCSDVQSFKLAGIRAATQEECDEWNRTLYSGEKVTDPEHDVLIEFDLKYGKRTDAIRQGRGISK